MKPGSRSHRRRSITLAERLRSLAPGATTVDEAIESVAANLLGDSPRTPVDLELVLQRVNARIVPVSNLDDVHGEVRRRAGGFVIAHREDMPETRIRFTVAHEIAHIVIDQAAPTPPAQGVRLERMCDRLAAALLMPRVSFMKALAPMPNIERLRSASRQFRVSLHAAAARCEDLTGCAAFRVDQGYVDWLTSGAKPSSPTIVAIVQEAFATGQRVFENVLLAADGASGMWTLEADIEEESGVFLMRPPWYRLRPA